jgi:GTPase-associated system helical domain
VAENGVAARLPTWLRSVEIAPNAERRGAILTTAEALAKTTHGKELLALVELSCGQPENTAFESLRAKMLESDTSYDGRADDRESHIIAGAALAALMWTSESPAATLAALGIQSASWLGLEPSVPDLRDIAQTLLIHRSEAVRSGTSSAADTYGSGELAALNDVEEDANPATHAQLGSLQTATITDVDALTSQLNELRRRLMANDEELDLLWWAFSGMSERAHRQWSSIPANASKALLAGMEMAKLTTFEVPLPSSQSLLARVLGKSASSIGSIQDAVTPELLDWRPDSTSSGHRLLPVLSCVSELIALSGDPAWSSSVKRWGIDTARQSTLVDLSLQTLREVLIARAI